jgi:hypothetical protein
LRQIKVYIETIVLGDTIAVNAQECKKGEIMKLKICCAIVVMVFTLLAGGAESAIITYNFAMDGLQETPPNASPAAGSATVTLDTATDLLSWNISFSGLLGTETASHFHNAPVGVPGPVVIPLSLGSPIIGSTNVTAVQATDIMNGLWYVNVHSTVFPGGEIRGQIVPEPATMCLLGLGVLGLLRNHLK